MDDPNAMSHHAARMLENPAWARLFADIRGQLDRERDRLDYGDEGRLAISVAETLLTKIERHAAALTRSGTVEKFNATNAARRVA